VPYSFEWDPKKAASNLKDHGVSFDEATTVFGDILAMNMPDPDHSEGEQRFLVLGMSRASRLVVVSYAERLHSSLDYQSPCRPPVFFSGRRKDAGCRRPRESAEGSS
jgi:uncharacterized DUF497 family protein